MPAPGDFLSQVSVKVTKQCDIFCQQIEFWSRWSLGKFHFASPIKPMLMIAPIATSFKSHTFRKRTTSAKAAKLNLPDLLCCWHANSLYSWNMLKCSPGPHRATTLLACRSQAPANSKCNSQQLCYTLSFTSCLGVREMQNGQSQRNGPPVCFCTARLLS